MHVARRRRPALAGREAYHPASQGTFFLFPIAQCAVRVIYTLPLLTSAYNVIFLSILRRTLLLRTTMCTAHVESVPDRSPIEAILMS